MANAVLDMTEEFAYGTLEKAWQYEQAIQAVIEAGGDVHAENSSGKTPLDFMKEYDQPGPVCKALITTVSPQEIQHIIPSIIILTNPKRDPGKQTVLNKNVGSIIASQLIPVIINEKLALANKYLLYHSKSKAELQTAIEQSIRRVIRKSPRIQAIIQEVAAQDPLALNSIML